MLVQGRKDHLTGCASRSGERCVSLLPISLRRHVGLRSASSRPRLAMPWGSPVASLGRDLELPRCDDPTHGFAGFARTFCHPMLLPPSCQMELGSCWETPHPTKSASSLYNVDEAIAGLL